MPNIVASLHRLRAAENQVIADLAEAAQELHAHPLSHVDEAEFLEATEQAWRNLFRAVGVDVAADGTVLRSAEVWGA